MRAGGVGGRVPVRTPRGLALFGLHQHARLSGGRLAQRRGSVQHHGALVRRVLLVATDAVPAEHVPQRLPEVDVEDEVEHEVAAEVDGLQHVGELDGELEGVGGVLVGVGEALLHEDEDLGGGDEQDVHEHDGDEDGRDAVVGVHVGGRDTVPATQQTRCIGDLEG